MKFYFYIVNLSCDAVFFALLIGALFFVFHRSSDFFGVWVLKLDIFMLSMLAHCRHYHYMPSRKGSEKRKKPNQQHQCQKQYLMCVYV